MHAVATVTECSAADVAFLFLNTVFKLHGAPQELVSDRDTRFTSAFWTEVCQLMQIKRSMSTAYHPQSDGQTERMNRVLEDMSLKNSAHSEEVTPFRECRGSAERREGP